MPGHARGKLTGRSVALLRGINVGGKHRLPMKDLVAIVEAAGGRNVRHYIQSGNVVFDATTTLTRRMPQLIGSAVEKAFGFAVPVVVRTAAQFEAVVAGNPFPDVTDPKALAVGFLLDRPTASSIAALDPNRSPGDAFVVCGQEIYLHFPNGAARSKLTPAYIDSRLKTTCTARNWNTVMKIRELL